MWRRRQLCARVQAEGLWSASFAWICSYMCSCASCECGLYLTKKVLPRRAKCFILTSGYLLCLYWAFLMNQTTWYLMYGASRIINNTNNKLGPLQNATDPGMSLLWITCRLHDTTSEHTQFLFRVIKSMFKENLLHVCFGWWPSFNDSYLQLRLLLLLNGIQESKSIASVYSTEPLGKPKI